MENLSEEILRHILEFVAPQQLLRSANNVSKSWNALISSHRFWQKHPLFLSIIEPQQEQGRTACFGRSAPAQLDRKKTTTSNTEQIQKPSLKAQQKDIPISNVLTTHQIQLICLYRAHVANENHNAAKPLTENTSAARGAKSPDWFNPQSVLPTMEEAECLASISAGQRRCCTASTTDHYGERLTNVLPSSKPRQHHNNRHFYFGNTSWWSSEESSNADSPETLLFATRYPLALLTSLRIQALAGPPFSHLCFTWKQTIVKAYRLPLDKLEWNPRDSTMTTRSRKRRLAKAKGRKRRDGDYVVVGPSVIPTASEFPCSFAAVRACTRGKRRGGGGQEEEQEHEGERVDYHHRLFPPLDVLSKAPPDHLTILATLEGHEPIFESSPFEIPPNTNDVYEFSFPQGGVVANVVCLELIGKNNRFPGHGYYACVEKANILGIPLFLPHYLQDEHQL
ncbi:hypothetical protein ACA910_006803 [Epithemia clementina (nom. ined.)]